MIYDVLARPIAKGDYVIFHNLLYEVLVIPKDNGKKWPQVIRIILVNKSKTTKPVVKSSAQCTLVPKEDVEKFLANSGIMQP